MSTPQPKLKRFVVRQNCEYSTTVEATTLEEANKIAEEMSKDMQCWDKAWSSLEVEAE